MLDNTLLPALALFSQPLLTNAFTLHPNRHNYNKFLFLPFGIDVSLSRMASGSSGAFCSCAGGCGADCEVLAAALLRNSFTI